MISALYFSPMSLKNAIASSRSHTSRSNLRVAGDDLAHLRLDRREVVRRERLVAGEVVVEAVLDRRADGDLGAGEQLLHRLGQHVGGVVADQLQRVGVAAGDEHHARVVVDRRCRDRPACRRASSPGRRGRGRARSPRPPWCPSPAPSKWRTEPSGRVMAGIRANSGSGTAAVYGVTRRWLQPRAIAGQGP